MARSPRSKTRGFFVLVEGADGSGKTTLARRIVSALRKDGHTVCPVREPGGTKFSEKVRRLLMHSQGTMNARAELFLFLAARSQLVGDVIRPALKHGEIVVADRFSLSTLAYQSGGRGLPLADVLGADALARDGVTADLTIVLQVTESQAEERLRKMGRSRDRIEQESQPFHRRVRRFYNQWERGRAGHLVIDSSLGPDEVFARAYVALKARLPIRKAKLG